MNTDSQSSKLIDYDGPDKIISSYEMDEIIKEAQMQKPTLEIKSGIPGLDYYTRGFRAGELVTVAGPTGEGKTKMCQTLTKAFSDSQHFPLWFSFEMPAAPFLRCFPSVPFFYMPAELKAYNWKWFVERCRENEAKNAGKIVIIDHLHFLMDFLRTNNPALEIGQIVRGLKRLAVDHGWIIFLICHITKIAEGVKATMRHIKDSSAITQESDSVIMVQRTKADNEAILTVDKCRWTGFRGKEVQVKLIDGYLRELADETKYPKY